MVVTGFFVLCDEVMKWLLQTVGESSIMVSQRGKNCAYSNLWMLIFGETFLLWPLVSLLFGTN